jgi:hypothetical protein
MSTGKDMYCISAMNKVPMLWLRTVSCSTLLFATSGASAQAKPDAASPPAASAVPIAAPSSASKPNDAVPTKQQCLESHHQAQQAQNEGKLVHARGLASTCTSLACPGLVITDCARWLNDLDQRIPSVVFEVRVDGQPNLTAVIMADGNRVGEWTRGESLRLDPGEHQFRFELAPFQPIIQNILLAEGMRYRIVPAEFKTPTQPTLAATAPSATTTAAPVTQPPPPMERPTPVMVYPLLGVGVLGALGFTAFGLIGKSKQSDLAGSCKPNCSDSDLKPMKTAYLVGDLSLGIGAASLIAAGVLYLARPEKPTGTAVGFVPLPGGAATFATYRF